MSANWFIGKQQGETFDICQRIALRKAHFEYSITRARSTADQYVSSPTGLIISFSAGLATGWLGSKESMSRALRWLPLISTFIPIVDHAKQEISDAVNDNDGNPRVDSDLPDREAE